MYSYKLRINIISLIRYVSTTNVFNCGTLQPYCEHDVLRVDSASCLLVEASLKQFSKFWRCCPLNEQERNIIPTFIHPAPSPTRFTVGLQQFISQQLKHIYRQKFFTCYSNVILMCFLLNTGFQNVFNNFLVFFNLPFRKNQQLKS